MRALCVGRPAEWWETGDDGNRHAIMFCLVCPRRPRCPRDVPRPHGVIVAGVAYSDSGQPLPLCAYPTCGYPVIGYRGGPVPLCHWCTGQKPLETVGRIEPDPDPDEAVVERLVRGVTVAGYVRLVDRREAFRRLFARGLTAAEVGAVLGVTKSAAQAHRRRDRQAA